MKRNPLISVIIPVKGKVPLKNCIYSLIKQPYRPLEIIINTANDNKNINASTFKKIKKENIKIIFLRKNRSMAQARKIGFNHSKGDFILHLDSDMTLSLQVLNDLINNSRNFQAQIIPEKSMGKGFWANCRTLERSCYIGDNIIESARFFSRRLYKNVGLHDDKLVFSEDKDLDLRIRQAGYKIGRISSYIYHHEGRISLINHCKKKFFYGQTADKFIKKHPLFALMEANVLLRPAYFRNWKNLVRHPFLACGIFILKFAELIAVASGLLYKNLIKNR